MDILLWILNVRFISCWSLWACCIIHNLYIKVIKEFLMGKTFCFNNIYRTIFYILWYSIKDISNVYFINVENIETNSVASCAICTGNDFHTPFPSLQLKWITLFLIQGPQPIMINGWDFSQVRNPYTLYSSSSVESLLFRVTTQNLSFVLQPQQVKFKDLIIMFTFQ